MPDPWLSERMKDYTYIRRAEAQLYPAIRDAVEAFLAEARKGPLGGSLEALTAAAEPEPGHPPGVPSEATWRRILNRFVLGPTRALWRGSFGRITGRPDDAPDDDQGHGEGLGDRLAGFRRAFADRLLRAILHRPSGESPAQLKERLSALMTLEEWDGQIMTMTRTETMTALNAGAAHGALAEQERTGQPWEKRWQCTHDQRVRETHLNADGQVRPLTEPFEIGGHRLQFPGDPLGPAGEVINCRCSARYGPAGDPALTAASAPQEESMTTPTVTETGPVTVEPSGRWRGVLGFMDEWSADQRMLATPEGGVRSRPLPLPLLVQGTLAKGHDGSELGVGVIDRIWTEGSQVWGEGRFDMEDPVGRDLARKVGLGFVRFVSLDVDDASAHQVLLREDGTIVPDGDPNDRSLMVGDVYDGWRIMGATLLAHPAFPNAAIALADADGQALTAAAFSEIVGYDPAWGCVKQDEIGAWMAADCEDPEAVPANPTGDGPFEPEQAQGEAPVEPEEEAVPAEDSQTATEDDEEAEAGDVPQDIAADDEQAAEELDPETPVVTGECVAPTEDGTGWEPAPCDAPGARPSTPDDVTPSAQMGVTRLAEDEDPASPASTPTHAGLAVKAQDTGRVLLIQRALDDEDPASGMWEWPGGGIEEGETAEDAAFREFCEETGCDMRGQGEIVDTWTSDNGVYQGFLLLVPEESGVGINPDPDDRTVLNPDDPDGDSIEVVAWWDPAGLADMGALREEVKATPWDKITAAGAPETEAAAAVVDEAESIVQEAEASEPPAGCEPCQAVAITASATTETFAPGWTPPGEWFEQPDGSSGAHSIRVDVETGQVSGYLAAWGSCHVGFKDRCVPPPHSASGYAYYNLRPVRTSTGTVRCGLITMNTGHAKLTASATGAMSHYDHTGTQAAVVRVGEDAHGIWVAGAVLPFVSQEDRLRLSLASFSGDWREVRGGAELIAALAVNSPGFPLAAKKTGPDGSFFSLVAAGFWPKEEEATPPSAPDSQPAAQASGLQAFELRQAEPVHLAAAVADELEGRAARRQRAASLEERMAAFRETASQRRATDLARRTALARKRISGLQPQRKTEVPMPLAGFGGLPTPSNQDIALAKNWVDQQGGLPPYIKRIADHLKSKGMDTSRAIATGVNAAKKMCASGDLNWPGIQQVNPGSKAEACAAIQKWEAMKAAARAS
jgi:8-oxo-dGTP pyrophosphatase MutT (NUDIX family)